VQRVSCLILSSGWCALALLGPSVVKWVCWGFPDLVRSSWDLVLVSFCLPPSRENWAWKSPCSLQCRAWKQKQQKPNQNGHSPKRNHQKGRHAIQKVRSKVRSKTKFWEVKKMYDQILEDTIVAFTLAKPQESLSKSSSKFWFLGYGATCVPWCFADRLPLLQVWTWNHRRSMGGCDFLDMMECGVPWGKVHPMCNVGVSSSVSCSDFLLVPTQKRR